MKAYQRVTRKVDVGEPKARAVMLDYWKTQDKVGLKRRCKGCNQAYHEGHITLCFFANKPNMILCEGCQPIPEDVLTKALQKRENGEKSTMVRY